MTASASGLITSMERVPASARLFLRLLERIRVGTMILTTPGGNTHRFVRTPEPYVELHIHDWSACRQIMQSGDIGFAEAYRDGKYSCNSIVAALSLALQNQDIMEQTIHGTFWGTVFYRLRHLLNRNTRTGSKKNIHLHYDISNDFYKLWLDESMTYSSALFNRPGLGLEQAQIAKYEQLLNMVEARRGDHILEIGCGWGAFAEYAATTRGCQVTGVSLSKAQLTYARRRVVGTAAEGKTEFLFMDYRDIKGRFDAVISIEMLEAVGEKYWPTYFGKLREVVKPGGKIGLQTITIADERFDDYRRQTDFIQQYIFPGGMLPSPSHLQQQVRSAGLMMLSMSDFGQDYAETLRQWRHRFDASIEAVRKLGFDEAFLKIWRFYLCYCEAGFVNQRTGVCQVLLQT
jgi:cyclopropane-fatty-acyl-phospholipid synthase